MRKLSTSLSLLISTFFVLAFPVSVHAQVSVPNVFRYTGYLTDENGVPLSGRHTVTTRFYNVQRGGRPFWEETQTVTADESGHYSVLVGAATPGGVPVQIFASGDARWISINSPGPDSRSSGRVLFASVPYALKAHDSDMVGGIPASQLMRVGSVIAQPAAPALPALPAVTPADLQAEALLRQQADSQVLQSAQKYADTVVGNTVGSVLNQTNSSIFGEQIRARQSEQGLFVQTQTEAARAQAAEALLGMQVASVGGGNALPQGTWIISASALPPTGYLFSGLTMQSTGTPSPEAAILLGSGAQSQTTFTLYLHIKAN